MTDPIENNERYPNEPDTIPSRLDELTAHRRLEQREVHRAGWRRNLSILGVVIAVAVIVRMLAR
jgi:hypothetical protein